MSDKNKSSINRSNDFHDLIDRLYGADKIFSTIAEILCFAAYLGLHSGTRSTVKSKDEPVPLRVFENTHLDRHLWAITLFDANDVAFLKDSDKCLETFEEYANGGMAIINDKLLDHPEDQSGIDTLSAMVAKVHAGFAAKTTKNTKDKIKF
jgi:dnd system-associated protein 4